MNFRAAILFGLIGPATLGSCREAPANPPETANSNILEVTENYARQHFPSQAPSGVDRAWLIEDHGDIWVVELHRSNAIGGGVRMIVRKRDMAVVGANRTQ